MLSAQSGLRSTGSRPALAAGYFFYFCVVGVYTPYMSLWLAAQGHSALVIGELLALASGLRIFGPFAVAWLFDHVRSRRGWFVAAAFAALGTWALVAAWPWLGDGVAPTVALLALAKAEVLSINAPKLPAPIVLELIPALKARSTNEPTAARLPEAPILENPPFENVSAPLTSEKPEPAGASNVLNPAPATDFSTPVAALPELMKTG